MRVVAPSGPEETAGYLGYYTKIHLDPVFDIMDGDGCWPAVWIYRKDKTGALRFFEEKPRTDVQRIKESERRILRHLAGIDGISCYVIWEADRLAEEPPSFPIELTRLAPDPSGDQRRALDRPSFDRWLVRGLPPVEGLLAMPYEPPADWSGTREGWLALDRIVTRLAAKIGDVA